MNNPILREEINTNNFSLSNSIPILSLESIIEISLFKYSCKLTPTEINWINAFLQSSPNSINAIYNSIQPVLSSEKSSIADIPKIISIISNICHSHAIQCEMLNADNIIILTQFIIESMIECDFLYFPETEKKIIENLIDTSITLLKLNIIDKPEITNKCWFFNFY